MCRFARGTKLQRGMEYRVCDTANFSTMPFSVIFSNLNSKRTKHHFFQGILNSDALCFAPLSLKKITLLWPDCFPLLRNSNCHTDAKCNVEISCQHCCCCCVVRISIFFSITSITYYTTQSKLNWEFCINVFYTQTLTTTKKYRLVISPNFGDQNRDWKDQFENYTPSYQSSFFNFVCP